MLLLALVLAAPIYPDYSGYVVDKARVLDSSATSHLHDLSERLNRAGIAQLAVVTVTPEMMDDAAKEEYAVDLFKKWGLGHGKKKADGLLLLFAPGKPGHRIVKVEVGLNLEGILPDGKT